VRNIAVNPRVALLIDEYDEDWTRLWYILIFGHATFISARRAQGRARAISILKAKYAQYSESMLAEDAPIIRIVPERTVFWNAV
jgi:hypothetical protein